MFSLIEISIHALREESDVRASSAVGFLPYFYPRPPRGERPATVGTVVTTAYFYPRPPRGERRRELVQADVNFLISIHALREESDFNCKQQKPSRDHFYPRPPRGERRRELVQADVNFLISIHALREESDLFRHGQAGQHFISIHALREESDSKNGEKHLRFCFIIKRFAQIWKSLSKNIQKNSCDLHRTA